MEEKPNHRVKHLRKALRKTQDAFATEINISTSLLSKIEVDAAPLTFDVIDKMESTYSFNKEWLVTGKGEMGEVFKKNVTSTLEVWHDEAYSELKANNVYLQTKLNQAMSMIEKLIGGSANMGKSKAPEYYAGSMLNKNIGLSGAAA